jgi:hypothetical protein
MQQYALAFALLPALAAAQAADTVLYAATDAGVHRSADLGRTWARIAEGLEGARVSRVVGGQRSDSRVLYAATDRGLFKTTDGQRWSRILDEADVASVAVDSADEQRIYVAASGRLFTSGNGGRDWSAVSVPFPVGVVATDPHSTHRLYLSATHNYDRTFATSTNRGETWQTFGWVRRFPFLVADTSTPGRLYTAMGGLLQSNDYGQSWNDIGPFGRDLTGTLPDGAHLAEVRSVMAAALERERPGDVHTCIEARWLQFDNPDDVNSAYTTGIVPGWASYVAGLWASGQLPGDQPCTAVVRIPGEDATLYAAGSKVYRRNGLLGRRVDLLAELGSPIRTMIAVAGQR